ncbi:hypothetical protein ABPG72_017045 [Tetrahymena utriculariae]
MDKNNQTKEGPQQKDEVMTNILNDDENIKEDSYSCDLVFKLLNEIKFTTLDHKPCKTSEESAQIRGVSLDSGAKAMLLKDKQNITFILAVMSASKKLSWKLIRGIVGHKKLDLAKPEEVYNLTKCIPGAVPPFGSIWGIKTLTDQSLLDQGDVINFNCGLRTKSISMKTEDYLNIEKPQVCQFTE